MSSVYYPAGCEAIVPPHYCNPCDTTENGRVRSVAFIKNTVAFTDPANPVEWETAIGNGDIIVIPEVSGTFNGGDPVTAAGYGDQAEKITGYNFELVFKDPSYVNNADFYNAIKRSRNYLIAYRTSTQTHISTNAVTVIPRAPVTETLTDEVTYEVTVRFSQGDLPVPVATPPGIFQCFDYTV
jgi:hypothetical protein